MKKKVLLLNPPGKRRYIRDYYCSKVSKAWYIYQPVDLLILSGILYEHFEIHVIDAIVRNLSGPICLEEISKFSPDAIIFLTGAVSKNEDFEFLRKIKQLGPVLTIGSGDFLLEDGEKLLNQEKDLDAIILDFTSSDIVEFINSPQLKLPTILSRGAEKPLIKNSTEDKNEFCIPVPRHEMFMSKRYAYPFVKKYPFATVLSDYGCPFKCPFCVMSNMRYKYRPVDNVLEEISYLDSLGIREIYFADQTFGANKVRTLQLLGEMKKKYPRLEWVCFSRVDLTDEKMVIAMKKAGCHTIIYGIESGSEKVLKKFKGIEKKRISEAIALCKRHKIRVVGTFIIGLPGETEEDIKETIDFLKDCSLDYASVNIAIPRASTELRREALKSNLWRPEQAEMDQSGTYAVMGTGELSKEEVLKWHRKANREFYLRPGYLARRLCSIKSWKELKINMQEGFSLMKGLLKS